MFTLSSSSFPFKWPNSIAFNTKIQSIISTSLQYKLKTQYPKLGRPKFDRATLYQRSKLLNGQCFHLTGVANIHKFTTHYASYYLSVNEAQSHLVMQCSENLFDFESIVQLEWLIKVSIISLVMSYCCLICYLIL